EADFAMSTLNKTDASAASLGGFSASTVTTQKLDWLATARPRLGYLIWHNVLAYGTGGIAIGKVESSLSSTLSPGCIVGCGSASAGATKTGWTVGGGIEAALIKHISLAAEYLYVDLGSVSGQYRGSGAIPTNFAFNSEYRNHIGRLKLNYKF